MKAHNWLYRKCRWCDWEEWGDNWENWEIEIKSEYQWKITPRVDLSQWFPVIKLIEWNTPIFEIIIQPEKLIKTEVYHWNLINLEWENYWIFNWGQVIMKDSSNNIHCSKLNNLHNWKSSMRI